MHGKEEIDQDSETLESNRQDESDHELGVYYGSQEPQVKDTEDSRPIAAVASSAINEAIKKTEPSSSRNREEEERELSASAPPFTPQLLAEANLINDREYSDECFLTDHSESDEVFLWRPQPQPSPAQPRSPPDTYQQRPMQNQMVNPRPAQNHGLQQLSNVPIALHNQPYFIAPPPMMMQNQMANPRPAQNHGFQHLSNVPIALHNPPYLIAPPPMMMQILVPPVYPYPQIPMMPLGGEAGRYVGNQIYFNQQQQHYGTGVFPPAPMMMQVLDPTVYYWGQPYPYPQHPMMPPGGEAGRYVTGVFRPAPPNLNQHMQNMHQQNHGAGLFHQAPQNAQWHGMNQLMRPPGGGTGTYVIGVLQSAHQGTNQQQQPPR